MASKETSTGDVVSATNELATRAFAGAIALTWLPFMSLTAASENDKSVFAVVVHRSVRIFIRFASAAEKMKLRMKES